MRHLSAIIFDFDGVIADSERLHLLAYQQTFASRGLALSRDEYFEEYLGYDDVSLLRRYGRQQGLAWDDTVIAALVADKTRIYEDLAARGEMLFPGARAFVEHARSLVPVAIASGALTREIEEILERARLRDAFVTIVGADQTARCKPSPDPYLEAFRRLERAGHAVRADCTVAIEDSMWGLVSARGAGLRTVAVTTSSSGESLAPYAELVVPGLEALTMEMLERVVTATPPRPIGGAPGRS